MYLKSAQTTICVTETRIITEVAICIQFARSFIEIKFLLFNIQESTTYNPLLSPWFIVCHSRRCVCQRSKPFSLNRIASDIFISAVHWRHPSFLINFSLFYWRWKHTIFFASTFNMLTFVIFITNADLTIFNCVSYKLNFQTIPFYRSKI